MLALLLACDPEPATSISPAAVDAEVRDSGPASADSGDGAADTGGDSAPPLDTADTAPPPPDGDGDGYPADVDCNDGDGSVYPGASDPCDRVDQDCDGITYDPGSCGEARPWSEVAGYQPSYDTYYPVRDMTGDGIADVFAQGGLADFPRPDGGTQWGWAVYAGSEELVQSPPDAPTDALAIYSPVGCSIDYAPDDVGDLDGDGSNDFVVAERGCEWQIWIHLGPHPFDGASRWMSDADELWTAPVPEEAWMYQRAFGGDFDGDGRNDYVGSEGEQTEGAAVAAFDVFFGGRWGETDVRVAGTDESARILDVLEDIDGDGLADLHAYIGHWGIGPQHHFLSGGDLASADGIYADDLQFAALVPETDDPGGDANHLGDRHLRSAGDWTGDGTADLVIVLSNWPNEDRAPGEMFLFDGTTRGEFYLSDAVGSWVNNGTEEHSDLDSAYEFVDADGDGNKEILVGDGWTDTWYLVPHVLPGPHTPLSGLTFAGSVYPHPGIHDVNGDGFEDVAMFDRDYLTGAVWLGWPVPFDDPSAW